jgi:hypothetical protein
VEVIGTVARLQVQRSRLKPGPAATRVYDPAPLLEVAALDIGPRGVVGVTADGPMLDVHHADHPESRKRRLANGLSLLPRAHYDALRVRYGGHVLDGTAGESLLLATDGPWNPVDLPDTLLLEAVDGDLVPLAQVQPAPPCVEFSRWCLHTAAADVGPQVLSGLDDLDGGARGFYAQPLSAGRVEAGCRLLTP